MDAIQLAETVEIGKGEHKQQEEEIWNTPLEETAASSIPSWKQQITIRAIVASVIIGTVYSIVAMKLLLTTGLVPSLSVSVALLGFVLMKAWTKLLGKMNVVTTPFTRQENTIIQTCAVACYSIALGGGFGSYLLALSKKTYELVGVNTDGNSPGSYKDPGLDWMIPFLLAISFVGILTIVPLRKILIIDLKLRFPSGTATAVLINGFHTSKGEESSKEQVNGFLKVFSLSFFWGFFQWFYSGGSKCGFVNFPLFGLQAWKQTFYFDFNVTYIGAGMICPHLVNMSVLLGAILSWGIMWPLIRDKKGEWYPRNAPESSMKSLTGYEVFIAIALILSDGIYTFIKVLYFTLRNMYAIYNKKNRITDEKELTLDEIRQNQVFMKDSIPTWIACAVYLLLSVIAIIVIPIMFPQLKWYYALVGYAITPTLCFCNAYGAGLTNMSMATNYGKVALFVMAAMTGKQNGVVAGLIGCSLVKSVVSSATELMHDFKTGQLTLTSPRSMAISQIFGTFIGCFVGPLTFFLFWKSFDIGDPNGIYKAPYALIYRNIAVLAVEGFSALPGHCLQLCYGFAALAVVINVMRDVLPRRYSKYMPIPMAIAIPFLVGAYFSLDMALGSLVVYLMERKDRKKASLMAPAIASGLICGNGLWILPSSILSLAKINPPICMSFSPGHNS